MRISNERRRDTEQRVRAAARALLAGEIPAGGKCDVTTLARQAGVSRAALYRSYPHLKAEFEQQLARQRASGRAPDPRDAQVLRLRDENARLKERLAAHESALAQLGEFKILALSRLTAQHEEIKRLRTDNTAAARASGTVRELPVGRTSRLADPGS
jgi:transposase-like protein